MSSITSIFRYKPLDPVQPDAIRVLEIVPGDDAATVECSLYTTTLSDLSGNYRAVSYAWGDVTERCIIKVNGFSLSITPNLNSVLRSFRAGEQQGKFWIDAICINQLDLDERSQQVQQMKEIYTEAREVWVWLGSGHPSRPLEASFLMSLAVRARQIGLLTPNLATMFSFPLCDFEPLIQEFTGESFHSQWRAVADLFAQPWWGRTWVIQELSSAKRATLYYGDVPIDLSAIILIIQMLRTCHTRLLEVDSINDLLRDKADAISGARELIFMWHIVNYSTRATLHSLLRLSRKTSCQDPRDKVFAVLGIAPAEVRMLYKPNYKESTIWVYGMAIMMYIHCHANLDILLNVDDGTSNAGLPSWIVDWNRKHQAQYFDYSGLSFRAGHHTTPVVAVPDGMRILNVEGFHIDIISETGVQGIELQGAERTNDLWTWDINAIVTKINSAGGVRNLYHSTAAAADERLRQSTEGALYDTITAGHQREWLHSIKYTRQQIKYPNSSKGAHPKPENSDQLLVQASGWTRNRTVILSNARLLGLAPAKTKPGDRVSIILGFCMPAILRAKEDGTWTFVGAAYVRGFMDGEALLGLESGIYRKEILKLA